MTDKILKGKTVLIIEPDIELALDLQDRLVDEGATVLTAYRTKRALDLVLGARLDGVVIETSVYVNDAELRIKLRERDIPHVVHQPAMPGAAVVTELLALVDSTSIVGTHRVTRRRPPGPQAAVTLSHRPETSFTER